MASEQRFNDRDIIERYTDQLTTPGVAAAHHWRRAHRQRRAWHRRVRAGRPRRPARARAKLAGAVRDGGRGREGAPERLARAHQTSRSSLAKVELSTGLSCHVLRVYGESPDIGDAAPMFELRFTLRQRRSMEGLAFLLEQVTSGATLEARDADAQYLQSVAQPIREAQALVSTRRLRSCGGCSAT